jgi:hypothetical protein
MSDAHPYHVLEFPLTQPPGEDLSLDFLPHGTRTLKIKLTNPRRVPDVLVLRSQHVQPGFGDSFFFSHEEGGTDFRVSWGGGHGKGACLLGRDRVAEVGDKKVRIPIQECQPLLEPAAETPSSLVYLNVTHTGGPFDRARRLLLVARPADDARAGPVFTLPVRLEAPAVGDPVRLAALDENKRSYTFEGRQVPAYLGRWWSEPKVVYREPGFPRPDLVMHMQGDTLEVAFAGNPEAPIVKLRDHIKFQDIGEARDFDAELYHFTGHYYVLRLWFFWLWQVGRSTWGDEVPDAERFDFVIDAERQRVVYAATDTHWREAWAPASSDGSPVEADLGLFSPAVVGRLLPFRRKKRDAWLDWMMEFAKHKDDAAGESPRIPVLMVRRALEETVTAKDLGPGVEAHVPYFRNCGAPESVDFVSSDPKLG